MESPFPSAVDMAGVPAGRVSILRKKHREDKDRTEWALMDSKGKRVLKWFGPEKPSDERVRKEERRVQYFKHQGCASFASVRRLERGALPGKPEFLTAFELEVPEGLYSVRGPRGESPFAIPDGDYGPDELWDVLSSVLAGGRPSAVYAVGAVLQTLGFEWPYF